MKYQKQMFLEKQPEFIFAKSGRCRVSNFIEEVEEVVQPQTLEELPIKRPNYFYNVIWIEPISGAIKTEKQALEAIKAAKKSELQAFDSSTEVNQFTLNGKPMPWPSKDERSAYYRGVQSEFNLGKEISVLSFGGVVVTVNPKVALDILDTIEIYAKECWNNTQHHLNKIDELTTVDEVVNYDFKSGYPSKVNFDL